MGLTLCQTITSETGLCSSCERGVCDPGAYCRILRRTPCISAGNMRTSGMIGGLGPESTLTTIAPSLRAFAPASRMGDIRT